MSSRESGASMVAASMRLKSARWSAWSGHVLRTEPPGGQRGRPPTGGPKGEGCESSRVNLARRTSNTPVAESEDWLMSMGRKRLGSRPS